MEGIARLAALLRALAAVPADGGRLSHLANVVGLTPSTAHRLLAALEKEHFVKRHPVSRRYQLGDDLATLGWWASSHQSSLAELARPSMERIAVATGDTAFLAVRLGPDSLCVNRCFGDFPIKTLTMDVGSVRPLGVGAGGLAYLSALDDREIESLVPSIAPKLGAHSAMSIEKLRQLIAETRRHGYARSDGLVAEGVRGLGIAILNPSGAPLISLSVAGTVEHMSGAVLDEAVSGLLKEKAQIERLIRRWRPVGNSEPRAPSRSSGVQWVQA